ncbi:MAG: glycosyltransferase family 4 protein [Candidatus Eisenbacteria sp.]|nr:glycosyltransferase family 4 protein [Candidatus Eisenbacteria bacterium]
MRIGMLLDKPFPPDPRVEAEANCLIEEGHEVHLLCLQEGQESSREDRAGLLERQEPSRENRAGLLERQESSRENRAGLQIHRFYMGKTFQRKMSALCLTLPFYDLWFRKRLMPFLADNRIQALHIHDLRLAREGMWAQRRFGIPWILDLHENYPASLAHYAHTRTLLGRLLIWPSAWRRFETRMVREAARVILVTQEAAEELVERTRISVAKVSVLPNVASRAYLERPFVPSPAGRFRLIYIGDTGQRRGTDLCIRAIARLQERIADLELVIAGTSSFQDTLERLVNELGVRDRVHLLGWRPSDELPALIESCHVGLAPFRRSAHHDTTYANKLFQCMALGRALIASDCPAQRRIVETEQCGLVFKSGDVEDLARCIEELHGDPRRHEAMGQRGRSAVRERFNWHMTGRALVHLYRELERAGAS